MVVLQVAAGGFVAGLDAGFGYNTWPLMDGAVVPRGLFVAEPWWRNMFENAMTVQFNHRILAYVIAVLVVGYAYVVQSSQPARCRRRWGFRCARHLDAAVAGAAVAGPCPPGRRAAGARRRDLEPAHGAGDKAARRDLQDGAGINLSRSCSWPPGKAVRRAFAAL